MNPIYRLEDPFLQFWYRIVLPNHSLLEQDLIDEVYVASKQQLIMQAAEVWEELARLSVSRLEIAGQRWKPASRWWGKGCDGKQMVIDVVAESMDGHCILFGEAKWEKNTNVMQVINKLTRQSENYPKIGTRKIILATWCKNPMSAPENSYVFNADDALSAVKN